MVDSIKQNIMIWGTGRIAQTVFERCSTLENYNIIGAIDNDISKIGTHFRGITIVSPESINELKPDLIVILTDYYDEILDQIKREFPEYENKVENKYYFFKESIMKRYAEETDEEKVRVLDYIKKHGLEVFNYDYVKKYQNLDIRVFYDEIKDMYYVCHNKAKMYFSRRYKNEIDVQRYYKSILLEQDEESPHRYLDGDFDVKKGDVVLDIGAAEGNFALEIIERVSKIYLIEADDLWVDALKETFAPYGDKVVIIQAYISSYDEGRFCRLDSLIKENVNFIKMDIEGNEWDGLLGAKKLISNSSDLKLAICTYHSDFDQVLVEQFMSEMNISHKTTNGYMWFPECIRQNYVSNRLNRAIVRGWKHTD